MSDYRKPKFKIITSDGTEKKIRPKTKFVATNKNINNETCHIPLFKIAIIVLLLVFSFNFLNNKYDFIGNKNDNIYLSDTTNSVIVDKENDIIESDVKISQEDNIAATVNIIAYANNTSYTSSGVIWGINSDNQLVILTAKHCVDYDTNSYFEIYFVDGNFYQADNVYTSNVRDFAFITIDLDKISTNTLNTIKTVKYDYNVEYKYGENVYVLGKHAKKGLLNYMGEIQTPNYINELGKLDSSFHTLVTNFPVVQGTSGGGIYNENGLLLGICSEGNEETTIFVPIYIIIDAYNSYFSK